MLPKKDSSDDDGFSSRVPRPGREPASETSSPQGRISMSIGHKHRHTGRRPRRSYRSRFRAERHRRQRGPRHEHGPYGPGHDGWRHDVSRDDGWLFFNYGYEDDPPMALALAPSDEPHMFFPARPPHCEPGALSGNRVLEATAEQRRILQERCTDLLHRT